VTLIAMIIIKAE